MAIRSDIHGEPRCPKYISDFLLRAGGTNPHGEPLYRCAHTTTLFKMQGGAWKTWADNLSVQERGGMVTTESGLLVPSIHAPKRVEICVKEVPKYPQAGFEAAWVLERWMAPQCSESQWMASHVPGHPDVPLLGPYPQQGSYSLVAGPIFELPMLSKLEEAMHFCQAQIDKLGNNLEQMIKDEEAKALDDYNRSHEKMIEEDEARFRDALSPWKSTSLEAGRWRNEMAAKAGVKEHA